MNFALPLSQMRNDLPVLPRTAYVLILALLTAILTDCGLLWFYWHFGVAADFAAFWRAVRTGSPYAYSAFPFGNPPTTLLILQPLKLLPFWYGLVAWDAVTFALFFFLGTRLYGVRAAMLGSISPAVIIALIAGQISLLVGALVFAAFLSEPIVCGVLLGVALCAKPQMVFLAPILFLFGREIRPLASLCATIALLALFVTFIWGPSIWPDWMQGMHNLLLVAKQRAALKLTISPMTYGAWVGLLSIPVSLLGLYLSRNLPNANRAAAVVAASLFAAPYSMLYDLAPLAVFASVTILRSSTWRSIAAALSYSAAFGALSIPFLWPSLQPAAEANSDEPALVPFQSRRTWRMPTRSA